MQQHYPPCPVNLQAFSFLQGSSMENPTQCRLLSHWVSHHPHFNPGREQYVSACFFFFFLLADFFLVSSSKAPTWYLINFLPQMFFLCSLSVFKNRMVSSHLPPSYHFSVHLALVQSLYFLVQGLLCWSLKTLLDPVAQLGVSPRWTKIANACGTT